MTTEPAALDRAPYCHKIRYGITGAPILTEDEMDGTHAPGVGVRPTLIELVYHSARDGKAALVDASVTGTWTRCGEPDPKPAVPVPPPTDRAAVLREAADRYEEILAKADTAGDPRYWTAVRDITLGLRSMAAEAPTTTKPETHACANCDGIDPDTCLMNPNRPPEQCPRSEVDGYGLQCQKPAGHNLCTFEEQPAARVRQDGAEENA